MGPSYFASGPGPEAISFPAWREGDAPAEPQVKVDVIWHKRFGRSLALPTFSNFTAHTIPNSRTLKEEGSVSL